MILNSLSLDHFKGDAYYKSKSNTKFHIKVIFINC